MDLLERAKKDRMNLKEKTELWLEQLEKRSIEYNQIVESLDQDIETNPVAEEVKNELKQIRNIISVLIAELLGAVDLIKELNKEFEQWQ